MPRGCKVFSRINPLLSTEALASQDPEGVRDIILHALLARVALCTGETIEFKTNFDKQTNTIELDFPDGLLPILDEILGMQRGPRLQAFIDWLIGKQTIIDNIPDTIEQTSIDKDFISSSSLDIWVGGQIGNLDDEKIVIFLPNEGLSVIGYNTKISEVFASGNAIISLIWVYESGDNGSNDATFDIQTTVSVGAIDGNTISTVSNITEVPTFNLVHGDIRETELINVSGLQNDDMLSIILKRNFENATDPETEFVGILGLKIKLIEN